MRKDLDGRLSVSLYLYMNVCVCMCQFLPAAEKVGNALLGSWSSRRAIGSR